MLSKMYFLNHSEWWPEDNPVNLMSPKSFLNPSVAAFLYKTELTLTDL